MTHYSILRFIFPSQVIYGHWLIEGYPTVLLFDIGSAAWKLDEWKHDFWNTTNIGTDDLFRNLTNHPSDRNSSFGQGVQRHTHLRLLVRLVSRRVLQTYRRGKRTASDCGPLSRVVGGYRSDPVPHPTPGCGHSVHHSRHAVGPVLVRRCCRLLQQPGQGLSCRCCPP